MDPHTESGDEELLLEDFEDDLQDFNIIEESHVEGAGQSVTPLSTSYPFIYNNPNELFDFNYILCRCTRSDALSFFKFDVFKTDPSAPISSKPPYSAFLIDDIVVCIVNGEQEVHRIRSRLRLALDATCEFLDVGHADTLEMCIGGVIPLRDRIPIYNKTFEQIKTENLRRLESDRLLAERLQSREEVPVDNSDEQLVIATNNDVNKHYRILHPTEYFYETYTFISVIGRTGWDVFIDLISCNIIKYIIDRKAVGEKITLGYPINLWRVYVIIYLVEKMGLLYTDDLRSILEEGVSSYNEMIQDHELTENNALAEHIIDEFTISTVSCMIAHGVSAEKPFSFRKEDFKTFYMKKGMLPIVSERFLRDSFTHRWFDEIIKDDERSWYEDNLICRSKIEYCFVFAYLALRDELPAELVRIICILMTGTHARRRRNTFFQTWVEGVGFCHHWPQGPQLLL